MGLPPVPRSFRPDWKRWGEGQPVLPMLWPAGSLPNLHTPRPHFARSVSPPEKPMSSQSDVAVGPVVDGQKQVEHDGAEHRIEHHRRRRDEEGCGQYAKIDGKLHQAGADTEALLHVDAKNADAAKAA